LPLGDDRIQPASMTVSLARRSGEAHCPRLTTQGFSCTLMYPSRFSWNAL
jgi:hypothetical protein